MEFILYGSRQQLLKCETTLMNVNGNSIDRAESIIYLGVNLDKNLKMKKHLAEMCKTAMFNFLKIKLNMEQMEACKTLVQGLVISHLDYSNAILAELPDNTIKKLQRVQHIAAKIILNRYKRSSITECLKQLLWLPVRESIRHKTLSLVHKCLIGNAPMYLKDLLQEHEGGQRHLRSKNSTYQEENLCSKMIQCPRHYMVELAPK